ELLELRATCSRPVGGGADIPSTTRRASPSEVGRRARYIQVHCGGTVRNIESLSHVSGDVVPLVVEDTDVVISASRRTPRRRTLHQGVGAARQRAIHRANVDIYLIVAIA